MNQNLGVNRMGYKEDKDTQKKKEKKKKSGVKRKRLISAEPVK